MFTFSFLGPFQFNIHVLSKVSTCSVFACGYTVLSSLSTENYIILIDIKLLKLLFKLNII